MLFQQFLCEMRNGFCPILVVGWRISDCLGIQWQEKDGVSCLHWKQWAGVRGI